MNSQLYSAVTSKDKDFISSCSLETWQNGLVIPVDKPIEWTSFDVIRKLKPRIPVKKIGHAGTLDPLATGVLVCCVGRATKAIQSFQEHLKTYQTTFTFGETTPSLDRATHISECMPWDSVSEAELSNVISAHFIGTIQQIPPMYSALKKDGKRLYEYARKGEEVDRVARNAYIESCEILEYTGKQCSLEIVCGKGTYIRTLISDIAKAVNSIGVIDELRRTKSGSFDVSSAWTVEDLCTVLETRERV